jgi:hypothetical protein
MDVPAQGRQRLLNRRQIPGAIQRVARSHLLDLRASVDGFQPLCGEFRTLERPTALTGVDRGAGLTSPAADAPGILPGESTCQRGWQTVYLPADGHEFMDADACRG